MADDRDPDGPTADPASGSGAASGGGRGGGDDKDQTREFDPFAEEASPTGDTDPDRTAQLPPASDGTRETPAGDQTRQLPGADETRQMPAADETARVPAQPAPWSGRAGVPPPDATVIRGPAPTEVAPPEDGDGRWWMPIVVGILGLLLLAALVTGVWLIYNANKVDNDPTPTPTPPTAAPTSAPATTAAPTSSSPPPPTTAPAGVPVPRLVGLTDQEARDELDRLGLSYRLVYRPSEQPADTVIETDPAEGETVPGGTEVTLVIASPLTPTQSLTTAPPDVDPTPTS